MKMSEREKSIIRDLAEKLPGMTERERGYLEGTIATAAAMSEQKGAMHDREEVFNRGRCGEDHGVQH